MKKTLLIGVFLCTVAAFSFAQGTHLDVGQSSAGAGVSALTASGLGVAGTYEYIFYKLNIPDAFPITFGGAAKAGVYFPIWYDFGIAMNVAGLGTAHLSLNAFPDLPKEIQNFDFYIDLGPSILVGLGAGGAGFGFGIASGGGLNYYFSPKTAINVDSYYAYHFGAARGGFGVSTLGIMMKL
ncbi:MAG TPA: hypothetical protein PK759_05750 [Spirochaetales bacterium]|nr:hypothetical protein [Spirochaetales bacterium]HPS15286.1 hypothetical protein [Spirochaetales bacterium]